MHLVLYLGDHHRHLPYGYIESDQTTVITGCTNESNIGEPIQCTTDALIYIGGFTREMFENSENVNATISPDVEGFRTSTILGMTTNPFYKPDGSLVSPDDLGRVYIYPTRLNALDLPNGSYTITFSYRGVTQRLKFRVAKN